jgi:hypothetical protein
VLAEAAAEEAAAAAALGVRRVGTIDDLRCLDEDLAPDAVPARYEKVERGEKEGPGGGSRYFFAPPLLLHLSHAAPSACPSPRSCPLLRTHHISFTPHSLRRGLRDGDTDSPTSLTLSQRRAGSAQRTPITPDVRLYHRAVVVAQEATGELKEGCLQEAEGGGRRVS